MSESSSATQTVITNKDKKRLCDRINTLSKTEHDEIFKILQASSYPFTQNNNGVFMDFTHIVSEDYQRIVAFVDFCYDNKTSLDEYDKKLNECKTQHAYQKLTQSTPLNDVIRMTSTSDDALSLQKIIDDARYNNKVESFVNILENRVDGFFVNKTNSKFINAKKKYSKKMMCEKKTDLYLQNDLVHEEYSMT
jgi:hypothetical protein